MARHVTRVPRLVLISEKAQVLKVYVQGRTTCGGVTGQVLESFPACVILLFFTRDKPRVTPPQRRSQLSGALTPSIAIRTDARLRSKVVSFDTTYCQWDLEVPELLSKKQGLITRVSWKKVSILSLLLVVAARTTWLLAIQLLLRGNLDVLVVIFF